MATGQEHDAENLRKRQQVAADHAGVIEALRDEPTRPAVARPRPGRAVSVLEQAAAAAHPLTGRRATSRRTSCRGGGEPERHADREIRNLGTELLRRELANNSPMASSSATRAAGSRGIYEGDPVPPFSTSSRRAIRESAMSPAWLRPRGRFSAGARQTLLWRCLSLPPRGANVAASTAGSVAGWERWLAASAGISLSGGSCTGNGLWRFWMRCRVLAPREDGQARRAGACWGRRRRRHRRAGPAC